MTPKTHHAKMWGAPNFNTVFHYFCLTMFCFLFTGFLKINAQGMGFWHDFSAPGSGFALSLCPEGGKFALSKQFPGGSPGDGQA